jgi:4-hydroxybenzoate polyprenyltransferase
MRTPSRRVLKAVGVSAGALALFGVVTGLIPNGLYVRMVPRTPLDYLFLVVTAGFLGAYTYQRTGDGRDDGKTAAASTAVGFLAFGCPICNAFLLALFSSSALMTYLDPLRPLLGAVSVVLFGGLLYVRSRRSCETCGIDRSGSERSEVSR